MKICFVSLAARNALMGASGRIGGAEIQVRRWTEYLVAQPDVEVHILVGDEGQPEREEACGATLWRVDQPPRSRGIWGRLKRMWLTARHLQQQVRELKCDIYIQRAAGIETGLVCDAAHAIGAKFIYMMASDHELEPPWTRGGGILGQMYRRGLEKADLRYCQTRAQCETLLELKGLQAEHLPNIYAFAPEDASAVKEPRGALWVGRCIKLKAPEHFIALARALPEVPMTMVALPSMYDPTRFDRINKASADLENLTVIPGVDREAMGQLYRQHAMAVNTSDWEGMPNIFLEAADHGAALLSLRVDPDGIFELQGWGYCAAGELDALREKIAQFHADPAACEAQAARGRAGLMGRHDVTQVGPQLFAALRRLHGERGGQA